jgi:hypothetical protein
MSDSNAGRLSIDLADTDVNSLYMNEGATNSGGYRDRRSWTIEFWMHPTTGGSDWSGGKRLIKHFTGGDYKIEYTGSNTIRIIWSNSPAGWKNFTDTFVVPVGEWTHVAVVLNRHQVPFQHQIGFVYNGVLNNVHNTYFLLNGAGPYARAIDIGNDGTWTGLYPPRQYNGMLDEIRISNVDRYGIPEPTTMSLLAIGLAGFLFRRKK